MSVEVILGRHGQCVDNAAGVVNGHRNGELTLRGQEQAFAGGKKAARLRLTSDRVDAVFSSPLLRSLQTATIGASVAGLPEPIVLPGLEERHLGEFTGMRVADALASVPEKDKIKTPFTTYVDSGYGMESFDEATERAREVRSLINRHYIGGRVMLYTHGDFGLALIAAYTGTPMRELIHTVYFNNCDLVRLPGDGTFEKL